MAKTIQQINERIRAGQAVVVDAEEIIEIVEEKGAKKAAEEVDVVTTGTFGPMCSSGAFLNLGHSKPKCKYKKAWLNGVSAYAGLAAVDVYLGATEMPEDDPGNSVFPGRFAYGGAHVIEDLVSGRDVELRVVATATDCYPRKEIRSWVRLKDLNQAYLCNPRNGYQNYNVAVNRDSDRVIYTYMGVLQPRCKNANYCSAGQLSPLLNDPLYRTIGVGTKIFLGGAQGMVYWHGTQHNPTAKRGDNGVPTAPAGTIATIADMKRMDAHFLRGASFVGYGVSLAVGLGVPIPVLDEEVARHAAVKDEDIYAQIVDYSTDYPTGVSQSMGQVSYKELKSGKITINGKETPTSGLSSYARAKEIATVLKELIKKGEFTLSEPVLPLPGPDSGLGSTPFVERPI